ncbi:23S rRNA (cytidine(2498)-2'-O)-methyltransferase RlmM [Alkalimarinus coralli]|uniref:23S rRNA (cytidine(2498)-2'-O)-methyltransferase RlmM n=1 Tax=Alkalimarinus coralli TaxID=2935863 RepID=UPI00202B49C0|nr:23S rRNA (cytidine(2498)-2'-O)-methyltransferase RlmM [Alkalimarinus coralli]
MNIILLYCRAGFEGECSQEIQDKASYLGVFGYCRTNKGQGFVEFVLPTAKDASKIFKQVQLSELVFARQWARVSEPLDDVPREDRVQPILEFLANEDKNTWGRVSVDCPDSEGAAHLKTFVRKFTAPIAKALRGNGFLTPKQDSRLHTLCLFFSDFDKVYIGELDKENSSRDHLGIPRLKFPKDAPSRSTLKLEEAWRTFLHPDEWYDLLGGHQKAVDLGACPGGWTWQLVNQGMDVFSVDHGPMDEGLMNSGHVTHVLEDGFVYKPAKKVDWMVCDIVDKPKRVSAMIIEWLVGGYCTKTVFNLKLPMKKRYQEVQECLQLIESALAENNQRCRIQAKHLYHDREEITCFIQVM